MIRRIFLLGAAALGLTQFGAPAWSEVANNTRFGDWIVRCDAVSTNRTACRLVQEQTLRDTGALVARFVVVPVSDGLIMIAQVPMGVYLPGGAVYGFQGNAEIPQRSMIWQSCANDLCEAAAPLTDEELALFAENEALLFGYRPQAGSDPVIVRVDIGSFTEAAAAIRETAN